MEKINLMKRDARQPVQINRKVLDLVRRRCNQTGRSVAREVDILLLQFFENEEAEKAE